MGSTPTPAIFLYVGGRQAMQQSPKLPYVGALPTQRAICGGSIIVVQESSKLRASERNRVTAPFWSRSSIGQSTALSRRGLRVRASSTPFLDP